MLDIRKFFNLLKGIFYYFFVVEICSVFILFNSIINFFYTVFCFKYVEKIYSYYPLDDFNFLNNIWSGRDYLDFNIPKYISNLTNFNRFSAFWTGQVEVVSFILLFFFVVIWCFNLFIREKQTVIFFKLLNASSVFLSILMFISLNVFWNVVIRELKYFVFDNNLLLDGWSIFSKIWILFFGLMFINFFKKSLRNEELNINISTDLVVLPIFGLFILLFLVSLINIFLILVVLEILSFVIIGLCVFNLSEISLESSIKYFVFNTVISGITIFGMFCLYYVLKNFNLIFLSYASEVLFDLFIVGESRITYYFTVFSILMFIFIFLFKLNMFPVCFYILDVYESLPFSLIFFLSAIVKPCIFFLFIKVHILWLSTIPELAPILLVFNISGMAIANIMAIYTTKIKRFLALTSISLFSLLGCCLAVSSTEIIIFTIIYLFIYNIVNYAILTIFFNFFTINGFHHLAVSNLNIICHKDNIFKFILSFYFLILSGLPPLFLFVYKYVIFLHFFVLNYIAVVIAVVFINLFSFYYYLNVIRFIWVDENSIETYINGEISFNNPYLTNKETYYEIIDLFFFIIFIFLLTIVCFDLIYTLFDSILFFNEDSFYGVKALPFWLDPVELSMGYTEDCLMEYAMELVWEDRLNWYKYLDIPM